MPAFYWLDNYFAIGAVVIIACPNPNPIGSPQSGPVSYTQSFSVQQFPTAISLYLETYHALWNEIHEKQDPTPEWFADWCRRVPKTCGCDRWLTAYLVSNPPRYDDWYPWTVEMHNAVNVKVGNPIWTCE